MATPAKNAVPDGMSTVTTHLWFEQQTLQAIELYKAALGAEVVGHAIIIPDTETVVYSLLRIGGSNIMMSDAWPDSWEQGPDGHTTVSLFLYVDDCDALFDQAVKAGFTVDSPMEDQYWGDRMGKLRDPYGHAWCIASHRWELSDEEIVEQQRELMGYYE